MSAHWRVDLDSAGFSLVLVEGKEVYGYLLT